MKNKIEESKQRMQTYRKIVEFEKARHKQMMEEIASVLKEIQSQCRHEWDEGQIERTMVYGEVFTIGTKFTCTVCGETKLKRIKQ